MFERFTPQARRAIFFARHEAGWAGHRKIEARDVLAGLAHEWAELRGALHLRVHPVREEKQSPRPGSKRHAAGPARRGSRRRAMPFSDGSKKVFRRTLEFAEQRRSRAITLQHLLVALARQDPAIGRLLTKNRLNPEGLASPDEQAARPVSAPPVRIGIGYDYHRLVEGRKLVLGGVEIPFHKGLAGHSDGDVLTHALCDALLGAAGLGDLGQHFPDTDPQWEDVSSLELLARVAELVGEKGLRVAQVDSVVVAQEPKLAPHFARMRESLARALGLEPAQVNVKAKTTEGLEAVGRGEAMAAQAIVLLVSR